MTFGTHILPSVSRFLAALAMAALLAGQIPGLAEASVSASPANAQLQSQHQASAGTVLSMSLERIHGKRMSHIRNALGDCQDCESGLACENMCISSCPAPFSVYPGAHSMTLDKSVRALHGSMIPVLSKSAKLDLHIPPPRL